MGYSGILSSQLYLSFFLYSMCLNMGDPTPWRTAVFRGNMIMTLGSGLEWPPTGKRWETSAPGAFQPAGPTIPSPSYRKGHGTNSWVFSGVWVWCDVLHRFQDSAALGSLSNIFQVQRCQYNQDAVDIRRGSPIWWIWLSLNWFQEPSAFLDTKSHLAREGTSRNLQNATW